MMGTVAAMTVLHSCAPGRRGPRGAVVGRRGRAPIRERGRPARHFAPADSAKSGRVARVPETICAPWASVRYLQALLAQLLPDAGPELLGEAVDDLAALRGGGGPHL